jgi:hypothetical protein
MAAFRHRSDRADTGAVIRIDDIEIADGTDRPSCAI